MFYEEINDCRRGKRPPNHTFRREPTSKWDKFWIYIYLYPHITVITLKVSQQSSLRLINEPYACAINDRRATHCWMCFKACLSRTAPNTMLFVNMYMCLCVAQSQTNKCIEYRYSFHWNTWLTRVHRSVSIIKYNWWILIVIYAILCAVSIAIYIYGI